jgi:hypothetical protein
MDGARSAVLSVLWAGLLLGIVGIVAFAGMTVKSQHDDQVRREIEINYGAEVASLCKTMQTRASGKLSTANNKYLVIDSAKTVIYKPYQDSFSQELVATSEKDITAVICVAPNRELLEECPYTSKSGSGTTTFTIYRYLSNMKVTLVDVATGQTVKVNTLAGEDPQECPEETRTRSSQRSDTYTGGPPTAQDFQEWLKRATR